MKRVVRKIEPSGSFEFNGKILLRVLFTFENHPPEAVLVEKSNWDKILDEKKKIAPHVSWNELKNEIYYSAVMQKHDRISEFNI